MVFLREIKFQWRSFLIWLLGIILVLGFFLTMMPTFQKEAETLKKLFETFPQGLLDTFGIDANRIFEAEGFVAYAYSYVQLLLGILGGIYGLTVVGREKIQKMNDFLLVKPLSRQRIFVEKVLVGLLSILAFNGLMALAMRLYGNYLDLTAKSQNNISLIVLAGALIHLFFFAFTSLASVLLKQIKNPVGLATGLSFGFYLLLLLARLMGEDKLKKLTPFGYLDAMDIMGKGFPQGAALALSLISLALLLVAGWIFCHQDAEV